MPNDSAGSNLDVTNVGIIDVETGVPITGIKPLLIADSVNTTFVDANGNPSIINPKSSMLQVAFRKLDTVANTDIPFMLELLKDHGFYDQGNGYYKFGGSNSLHFGVEFWLDNPQDGVLKILSWHRQVSIDQQTGIMSITNPETIEFVSMEAIGKVLSITNSLVEGMPY